MSSASGSAQVVIRQCTDCSDVGNIEMLENDVQNQSESVLQQESCFKSSMIDLTAFGASHRVCT